MKNKEVVQLLNGIQKLEGLKLGGINLRIILKNKKVLMAAYESVEEVKKQLIDQYKGEDEVMSKENETLANFEFIKVWESDADVELTKMNSASFDQFSDLTLEQMEVLEFMAE